MYHSFYTKIYNDKKIKYTAYIEGSIMYYFVHALHNIFLII